MTSIDLFLGHLGFPLPLSHLPDCSSLPWTDLAWNWPWVAST